MNGYQSDQVVHLNGNIPVQNTVGDYGQTQGMNNSYTLTLDPPLTSYPIGLTLHVQFHQTNWGSVTLNVDEVGAIPIQKINAEQLVELEAEELATIPIYELTYDGSVFQIQLEGVAASALPPGIWKDKGILQADSLPDFPPAQVGDVYTIQGSGYIGDNDEGGGIPAHTGDLMHCLVDNEGGGGTVYGGYWNFIRSTTPPFFRTLETLSLPEQATTALIALPHVVRIPPATIKPNQGIKILFTGRFIHSNPPLSAPSNKKLRINVNGSIVFTNNLMPNPVGPYQVEILLYNVDNQTQKGISTLAINQQPIESENIELSNRNWKTHDIPIVITIQSLTSGQLNIFELWTLTVDPIL